MHFVPYLPPERVGGVGEFVAALHGGLLQRGHDSQVVTTGAKSDGPVHRIARSRLGWFVSTLCWIGAASRCDVVHCQAGEALPVMLGLRLLPWRRARILVTFHVSSTGMLRANAPYRIDGRRLGPRLARHVTGTVMGSLHRASDALALRLADGLNTIARSTARELLGRRLGATSQVIYNPLPPASAASFDAEQDVESVDLFYAGLATHRKRVALLPFVLARVRRARPGTRLRIAGFELDEAAGLRALFEEQGCLDAVECIGRRRTDELPAHYRAARVVLIPSAYEGLPYVMIEALQQGTPVVATRVSGHPEVIEDGVGGLLVPVDDPAAMATACLRLLRDPGLATALGEAGRRVVAERFDPDRQVDAYLHYYRALSKEAP